MYRIFERRSWEKLQMPKCLEHGGYNMPDLVVVDAMETDRQFDWKGIKVEGPCMSTTPLTWEEDKHRHLVSYIVS